MSFKRWLKQVAGRAGIRVSAPAAGLGPVIHELIRVHQAEARGARDNLEQLHVLLADVVVRLTDSFERLGALNARPAPAPSSGDGRDSIHDHLDSTLLEAIVVLQFPDIATQLIERASSQITRLEQIAVQLDRLPEAKPKELIDGLNGVLARPQRNPVTQARMTHGTTELFETA